MNLRAHPRLPGGRGATNHRAPGTGPGGDLLDPSRVEERLEVSGPVDAVRQCRVDEGGHPQRPGLEHGEDGLQVREGSASRTVESDVRAVDEHERTRVDGHGGPAGYTGGVISGSRRHYRFARKGIGGRSGFVPSPLVG